MEAPLLSPSNPAPPISQLDMNAFTSNHPHSFPAFLHSLRHACRTVGLFYLTNHGIPHTLCDSIIQISRRFFELPLDVKLQMDYRNSPQFRGYMILGCENTNGLTDYREQIELGPEEEEEIDVLGGSPSKLVYPLYRRLRGPNQWPPEEILPEFRPIVEEYMMRMHKLSMSLLQAIALSLGLARNHFEPLFGCSPHRQLKVLRYPMKKDKGLHNEEEFGVGPHTDSGFLTLLLQDGIGGLQAKTLDGEWKDVPPKSGTFVVNLGEMLQLATCGFYVATVHQVLNIPSNSSRYSVPFFFNPRLDAEVRCMEVDQFEASTEAAFWQNLLQNGVVGGNSTHGGKNRMLPVYGENAFKSFSRSHLEVVKRHHPDCLGSNTL